METKPKPTFDHQQLRQMLIAQQQHRYRQVVHSSLMRVADPSRPVVVRRLGKRAAVPAFPLPDLRRQLQLDPDDIGTRKRRGFNAEGKLIRRQLAFIRGKHGYVQPIRHLAMANTMPATSLDSGNSLQLRFSVQKARMIELMLLHTQRLRELRELGCQAFRSTDAYAQCLYCPPTGTSTTLTYEKFASRPTSIEFCNHRRICPYCWTQSYVVDTFFRLRAAFLDLSPDRKRKLRADCKLVVVKQAWTRPGTTHPTTLLRELHARHNQLYSETPFQRRDVVALAQLCYVEPPMVAGMPWLLHRRAILCYRGEHQFGYPHDEYDVRNSSTIYEKPTLRRLMQQIGRTFHYPLAYELAPANVVRRLHDAYVQWPLSGRYGFRLFSTRGCLKRAKRDAYYYA